MTTQPEALRLADALEREYSGCHQDENDFLEMDAAAELRRLHELNEDLYQQGVGFIARIAALEKALGMAVEALDLVSLSVKIGLPEYDLNDTLEIAEAAASTARQTLGGEHAK